jgi:hypothetical protein
LVKLRLLNPLSDTHWDDLVSRHPRSSVFHDRGWLEALQRTYGYEPLVLTSSPAGQPLTDGIVFCRVSSWATGTRLVSLPFSDHCDPLLDDPEHFQEFLQDVLSATERFSGRYFEFRPRLEICGVREGLRESGSYCLQKLCLEPNLEQIFNSFHHDSIQRKIRRAERELVSYETGNSESLLKDFYHLLVMTRKRHYVLPQPLAWFRNLVRRLGDKIQIRLARTDGRPIAAVMSLRHGSSVVYKYGCSDERFHNLGGMPFLFWRLIEESKASGAQEVDFGRSDLDQEGLITFKDRLGASRSALKYYRYSANPTKESAVRWGTSGFRRWVPVLPEAVLMAAGRILYRHMG